ncbi:DNA-directed RNA polymerase specialized sigma subunit [Candidatus Vecturithrix granuli]|uniref:DNA-directed RNA polymerase specialized sigma subunit n=1 Tax=Vecturithrix granuli TaxID=1499967 RepID=A0A081BW24_VECG1|nr:DNA-directed RNA polymerase specialized sigma subunit [Candidatus Vecturithrix granuli]
MTVDVSDKEEWQEELSRALNGDREALGRLCEGYIRSKTYAYTLNILKNAQDAEDIVQSIFAWLVEHHGRIASILCSHFLILFGDYMSLPNRCIMLRYIGSRS